MIFGCVQYSATCKCFELNKKVYWIESPLASNRSCQYSSYNGELFGVLKGMSNWNNFFRLLNIKYLSKE